MSSTRHKKPAADVLPIQEAIRKLTSGKTGEVTKVGLESAAAAAQRVLLRLVSQHRT